MQAFILSIGDELVLGQTVDTNSAWISRQLASIGCPVSGILTVSDDQSAIEDAIRLAASRCNCLIITGGLGPTEDDLTRHAIAAVLNQPLELNEAWLEKLKEFFTLRRRPMPRSNTIQAMIPRGCHMIDNPHGTAPGIHCPLPAANCQLFSMPGVPKEMKPMFLRDVLPHIARHANGSAILSRTLHTFGLGESSVGERLGQLMDRTRNPSVGTTVSDGFVSLRINARFPSLMQAQEELERTTAACREILGDLIFGQDDQTLPQVLAQLLTQSKRTVTTAESCTGGLLAKMLTDVSGSSDYFHRGWITYANSAKQDLLGVPSETLTTHGAVSEQTAAAMATGARSRAGADYALAISGIAGPTGGTPAKPVGTVCIALADSSSCLARTFNFPGDREMIRDRAAKTALTLLRFHLLSKPLPF